MALKLIILWMLEWKEFWSYKVCRCSWVVTKSGRLLKPWKSYNRENTIYLRVTLHDGDVKKVFRHHRLVSNLFNGPVDGLEVDHNDRITTNNWAWNLENVSAQENKRRRVWESKLLREVKNECAA